jgi:hypothetical protein
MMPASVRVGPFAGFASLSGEKPEFVNKARAGDSDQGSMRISHHNATHFISIPGNRLFGGDLAANDRGMAISASHAI